MMIDRTHLATASMAAVAVWLFAGCGAPAEPAGADTRAPAPSECPAASPGAATAQEAATCLYDGWVDGDAAVVAAYGAEGVTDELPTVMEDPELAPEGCEAGSADDGGVVCTWRGRNSDGDVALHLVVSQGEDEKFIVTRVEVER